MTAALAGIRVLDLTRVVAGPWCTQTLADLGAEVIKVEKPGGGDDTRRVGPFVGSPAQGDSAFFLGVNRNKKSIAVDIGQPAGQAVVRELIAQCDVLVENFKVGDLKRYGLDHASLVADHPKLIYCSVTGFGQDGPYAGRPAYDSVMQAMCGLMSTCGHADGEPGAGPMRSAVPIADIFTGLYATIAVQAALAQRSSTGRGQFIDMAMIDATTAVMGHLALGYLMTGDIPRRQGNDNPITSPSGVFQASDGHFSLSAGNDGQFATLLRVLGLPMELASDPRFASNIARLTHRRALHGLIESVTLTRPVAEWIGVLSECNVPSAPINDLRQLFEDPQVRHRGLQLKARHASGQDIPMLRSPLRLPDSPVNHAAAPMLGQHTDAVLKGILGKTESELGALRALGVLSGG